MADHTFYTAWMKERDRAESAEAEVRALTARLNAAHTAIRRYGDGWKPGRRMAVVMAGSPRPEPDHIWMHNDMGRDSEPMSPAEAAEIRAATADPTPPPDTPKWDPEVFPSETFPAAAPTPQTDSDT
jgi:hypothetical protein